MTDVQLEVHGDEREVLLHELDGFLEMTAALYRQIGREWDASALPPEAVLVARARDQLAGDGPWRIEGTAEELDLLLGRLRAGAELALQRGAQSSPARGAAAMHAADAEGTDTQLDILRVSDILLARLAPPTAPD